MIFLFIITYKYNNQISLNIYIVFKKKNTIHFLCYQNKIDLGILKAKINMKESMMENKIHYASKKYCLSS